MFFALQKFIGYLLMPAGLVWMGLLGMAIWSWRKRLRGFRLALTGLFMVYTLAGNYWLGEALIGSLERRIPDLPVNTAPLDAVFVLGGGSELDRGLSPELSESGDRIAAAARLWHAGRVRTLVCSGASDDGPQTVRNLGEETRALWRGMGIPDEAIFVVPEACRNTRQEIAADQRLQVLRGWRRVGLLSSAWHLPRALTLAQRAGLNATPIPSDVRNRSRRYQIWHLVPQHRGFALVELASWEYLGRWTGR